jgi:hypothetical protein
LTGIRITLVTVGAVKVADAVLPWPTALCPAHARIQVQSTGAVAVAVSCWPTYTTGRSTVSRVAGTVAPAAAGAA